MPRLGLFTPIKDVDFSVRTLHVCQLANISNVLELIKYDTAKLKMIRHCGKRVIEEITNFFNERQYLKEDLRFYEMATTIAHRALSDLVPNVAKSIYITYLSTKLNCNGEQ